MANRMPKGCQTGPSRQLITLLVSVDEVGGACRRGLRVPTPLLDSLCRIDLDTLMRREQPCRRGL